MAEQSNEYSGAEAIRSAIVEREERKHRERLNADLAEIKDREENVRSAIRRGEPTVDTGPFGASQLDLHAVVADRWGRMWRVDGTALTLISGPRRVVR